MKKIIALMLVFGCMLAFASCSLIPGLGGNNGTDEPIVDNSEGINAIQAAIDASAPDMAQISVVLVSSLGSLNGEYNIAYNDDGSATVDYSYELFNSFESDALSDGIKSTYTGMTTIAPDGTVVDALGGVASVEAITFDIKLDESKLKNVAVSPNTISAEVAAADTLSVLGVALGYDADIVISIGTNGVASIAISYTTPSGNVDIVSIYTYIIEEETEDGTEGDAEEGTEEGTEEGSEEVTE